jgi:NhaP-type Na+/H+ or K+/H+ antiporter
MEWTMAIVAATFVAFAVVSRRLSRSALTGTMLFAAVGVVLGAEVLGLVDSAALVERSDLVGVVLTGTLVIVLFTDASAINSSSWRDDVIPARLLGIGLPLAIGLGWLLAVALFGALDPWEAALLATMLAPTDAALGKAVVANERVPRRIRQSLNIESGLNDGIALPLFVVFLEAAVAVEGSLAISEVVTTLLEQVGVAVVVGIAVGWVGALAISWGRRSGAALGYWLEISLVGLAVGAYAIATPLGGSGFIAAWVAGFVFGKRFMSGADDPLPEFAESLGDLLTMASFLVFGLAVGPVLFDLNAQVVIFGVLSLFAVRTIAVAIALLGSSMQWRSVLYIGWFGPRGLATIILTIEIVEESALDGASLIADVALFTVALSVVLHGATAWWGSNAYADFVEAHPRRAALEESAEPTSTVRVPFRARQHPSSGRATQAGRLG